MTSLGLVPHGAPPTHAGRDRAVLLLAALLLLCPLGGAPAAAPTTGRARSAATSAAATARDQASIRTALAQHVARYNARDWRAMRAEYTEDALVMPSYVATVQGGEGVNALYRGEFSSADAAEFNSVMEAQIDELQVHGDLAFDRGTITITTSHGGFERKTDIRFMNIRRRQPDGGWKITHSMDNPIAPPFGAR